MNNKIIGYLVVVIIVLFLREIVKFCGFEITVITILAVMIKNMISDLWE